MTAIAHQPASAGFFTPERLRTIRLYGKLGTTFGRVHRMAVANTAEAVRALCSQLPGFEKTLLESKDRGIVYACFIGTQNIGETQLAYPVGDEDIRIAPILQGSGRGGFFQIVLGAALIGAAFLTGGASLGATGLMFSGLAGQMAFGLGVSMFLGGVSQLLAPQQKGLAGVESPDNGASYNFNGPVNVTAQGNPVPLLYGEAFIGSATVSAGLYAEDQQ